MIHRSFDASEINAILNDPSVFEAIKFTGITSPMDVSPIIDNPVNVLLMAEGGGIIFAQMEPGIYEVHTSFLENHRGRHAIRASLAAYRWMFTHTDCMILQTKVPEFNVAAAKFCSIVGAIKEFERKGVWLTESGAVGMSYWIMKYEDWIRRTSSLMESGRMFHDRLEQEFERHSAKPEVHPDEDCHDLYVGACAETIYAGQPEKAIVLYNRWARFSGYGQISLISKSPLLIDIGSAVLQVVNDNFRVIKCRQPL
jgi:hypothetical protein